MTNGPFLAMTQQDGMQLRGGGQFTARPHLLTLDGQTVLVCHGNFVRAHSAVTGEPLYRLTGHTAEVTAVLADPDNAKRVRCCLVSGGRDGGGPAWFGVPMHAN